MVRTATATATSIHPRGTGLLFSKIGCEVPVVVPLDTSGLAVDVLVELFEQGLAVRVVLHCLEVVSHLCEELLLVDPTVELTEDFVAFVVPNASARVRRRKCRWLAGRHLHGFLGVENTEVVGVVHVVVCKLVELRFAQVVDHQGPTRSHKVGSDGVDPPGYLQLRSVLDYHNITTFVGLSSCTEHVCTS